MQSFIQSYIQTYSINEESVPQYIKICNDIFSKNLLQIDNILLIEPHDAKLVTLLNHYFKKTNICAINIEFTQEDIDLSGNINIINTSNINSLISFMSVYNKDFNYIIDNNPSKQIMRYMQYKVLLKPNGYYIFTNAEDINSNRERFLSLSRNVQIYDANNNSANCVSIQK